MHNLLDPSHLVKSFGYLGIFLTVFLESGIVFGFFLPGDSLLFTAGLLASQGYLNIVGVIIVSILGAILGNNTGYATGRRFGPALFEKDSRFFSKKRIAEAHSFFEDKGPEALILARFIPAGRTFIPIIAGAVSMQYKKFFTYNALGGSLWGFALPILGFTLGKTVPNIDKYLLPAIAVIIILSVIPAALHFNKQRSK